jgi:hypothetical protein
MGMHMNNIDVLISRLTWPSVLVRERAAVALADLISQEGTVGKQTQSAVIEWLGQQNLESAAILGILVFCRLADRQQSKLPEHNIINQKIKKPSLLSFELMRFLYSNHASKPEWMQCHSGEPNSNFEPPEFFVKFKDNFLPPIYGRRIQEVQERTLLPMFRQWAFEWAQLVSNLKCEPSAQVLDFGGRPPGMRILVDFPLSEVYRSAYLRSLAWAVNKGKLSEEAAFYLACEACPIDLGLWRVQPRTKPPWWPSPKSSLDTIDTVHGQLSTMLSELWNKKRKVFKEKALLAASGNISCGASTYSISIRAMFQVATGPIPGDPAEIMKACDEAQGSYTGQDVCFSGTLDPISPEDISIVSNDWSILPASIYVRSRVFSRWQYWRGYRGIQFPAPFLTSKDISFDCEPDAIRLFEGANQIGTWQDWTDGVTEEFINDLPYPHGWMLLVRSDLVDKFSHLSHSTLCWICEVKMFHRKHEYENFNKFSTHHLYGTTNLILPA